MDVARRAVKKVIRTRGIPLGQGVEWDDVMQVGMEALCGAAEDWDRRVPFAPFAFVRVGNRVIDWLRNDGPMTRSGKRKLNTVPWIADSGNDDWHAGEAPTERLLRVEQLTPDHAEQLAADDFVSRCLGLLSDRERRLVTALLLEGRTCEEVAEEEGLTVDRIYRLRDRAIQRLRGEDDVLAALV